MHSEHSDAKGRPAFYDKRAFFERFAQDIQDSARVASFTVLYDPKRGPVEAHFVSEVAPRYPKCSVVSMEAGCDPMAYINLMDLIERRIENGFIQENDVVYVTEDDYTHRTGWIDILMQAFEEVIRDRHGYATLYDHPDKYTLPMYANLTSQIMTSTAAHWRTTPSTTSTHAFRARTLLKDIGVHRAYCDVENRVNRDHARFLELWKQGSFLISSIPAFAAHVESGMLPPAISWS